VPAGASGAEISQYAAQLRHAKPGMPRIVLTTAVVSAVPTAAALAAAFDALPPTGRRCPASDPYDQAIFFTTAPGQAMRATVVDVDTACGTVQRPVTTRLYRAYRETPALAAELRALLHADAVDGGPQAPPPGPLLPAAGGSSAVGGSSAAGGSSG